MRRNTLLLGLIAFVHISAASAQTPGAIHGELDLDLRARLLSTGHSTLDLYRTTVRIDAQLGGGLSAKVEGDRAYDKNVVRVAALEKDTTGGRLMLGLVPMPFGIYDTQETYASGLINYPIARSDYELNAVDWTVPGAFWSGGTAALQIEAAAFNGASVGDWNNRNYATGGVARLQTYYKDVIVGASRWDGALSCNSHSDGRAVVRMNGLDWRYTRPQLVVRGEYLVGTMARDWTQGWYTDVYYRLPKYGRWTVVGRLEQLKPASDENTGTQLTTGVRYVPGSGWDVALNWVRNNGDGYYARSWNPRTRHSGDLILQLFHSMYF